MKKVSSGLKLSPFGKRRNGKSKKSVSKSINKQKKYRGQGR